jgi:hypothetical protein
MSLDLAPLDRNMAFNAILRESGETDHEAPDSTVENKGFIR